MSKHAFISYVKSAVRIVGYFLLVPAVQSPWIGVAVIVLVASEVVGIYEEVGL